MTVSAAGRGAVAPLRRRFLHRLGSSLDARFGHWATESCDPAQPVLLVVGGIDRCAVLFKARLF